MSSFSLSQAGGPRFLPLGTGEGAQAAGTRQGWNGRQGRGRWAAWGRPGWLQPAVQAPLVGNTFASHVRTRFSSRGIQPMPPLGSQVARCLPKQAAWSKPRCAKAETAPGNHRIALETLGRPGHRKTAADGDAGTSYPCRQVVPNSSLRSVMRGAWRGPAHRLVLISEPWDRALHWSPCSARSLLGAPLALAGCPFPARSLSLSC